MSNVIAFPTALTAPVVQQRRAGRLPKSIGSLRMVRAQRIQAKMEEELKQVGQRNAVAKMLFDLAALAPGEIRGVVVIACDNDLKPLAWVAGACASDPLRAYRMTAYTSMLIKRNMMTKR